MKLDPVDLKEAASLLAREGNGRGAEALRVFAESLHEEWRVLKVYPNGIRAQVRGALSEDTARKLAGVWTDINASIDDTQYLVQRRSVTSWENA